MLFDEYAARIQTVSSIPCPHGGHGHPYSSREGVCIRNYAGDWWQVNELHAPLTCDGTTEVCFEDTLGNQCHGNLDAGLDWVDGDTPGAVPHTKPEPEPAKLVKGTMVFAAMEAWDEINPWTVTTFERMALAIKAALAAQDK
jgi:hypothetical protein